MEIDLKDVSLRYGRHLALDGISLHLTDGVTGLLGPNGAGKSTLMKVLATLLWPQSGRVRIGPWELPRDQQRVREHLGYLPQEFGLPENLTGWEYLCYAAAMKGVGEEEAKVMLAEVGLEDVAHRRIRTYSGGMKQRLAIAQALLGDPDLVIVDEPTAGLDPQQRTHFRYLLTRRRRDRITLFSTHVVADLAQVADQVVVIHRGRIRFVGTLSDLAARAEGKVWLVQRDVNDPAPVGLSVISEHWDGNTVTARVFASFPPGPDARPAEPEAEDGYFAVISEAARQDGGERP